MRVGREAWRLLEPLCWEGGVGQRGKGLQGLLRPKAAVQPLELLLPVLQSLQAMAHQSTQQISTTCHKFKSYVVSHIAVFDSFIDAAQAVA